MNRGFALLIMALILFKLSAQEKNAQFYSNDELNWYNKDFKTSHILGTSVDLTYDSLLAGKKTKKTVIVAIIDAGVDIHHEDLAGQIWTNPNEIPGNWIDDDMNGYVDDINGWNFIGNKNGENIEYENYEFTRLIKDTNRNNANYYKALSLFNEKKKKKDQEKAQIDNFEERYHNYLSTIKIYTGVEVTCQADLNKVNSEIRKVQEAKKFLSTIYKNGFTDKDLLELKGNNENSFKYYLNKDFDPRSIIGDNPDDINDNDYGNNDVIGPQASHGTSVAGIIAAVRNNNLGIDGIAADVKIMVLRVVPNGDERDKDVALAIHYAVDNGASIINMSFGKAISPQKLFVDEAIRYAEKKGVLLIHAAGNDGNNIDSVNSYPNKYYEDGTEAANWLTIGAIQKQLNKNLPAVFSNYGKKMVDFFAPGVDIVSLDTSNTYSMHSGTSVSAPVVTGIAALLLSYYPDLKPQEIIEILNESTYQITKPKKVFAPGLEQKKKTKLPFRQLSKNGGIVNAYNAMKLAEKRSK